MRLKTWSLAAAVALLVLGLVTGPLQAMEAAGCSEDTACSLSGGDYYIHLPETWAASSARGAIFFLHGHRGKAVNAIRNQSFRKMADELGVALVAVQGVQGTWSFPTAPEHLRNEPQFFDAVLADLEKRFGIGRTRTLLSGFSSGAFMTWYLACDDSRRFAGFAPISGAFWEPLPESCPTDAPYLFHVHGTSDKVVPLAGRWLGGHRWKQGDVYKSFDVWRRQTGLIATPPETYQDGGLSCERWVPENGMLELCLHQGGHSVDAKWIRRAWTKLGALKGWVPKS